MKSGDRKRNLLYLSPRVDVLIIDDNTPIVSEPEFQRIVSLFRIKGIVKLDNGEVAPQRRGRPTKTTPIQYGGYLALMELQWVKGML